VDPKTDKDVLLEQWKKIHTKYENLIKLGLIKGKLGSMPIPGKLLAYRR